MRLRFGLEEDRALLEGRQMIVNGIKGCDVERKPVAGLGASAEFKVAKSLGLRVSIPDNGRDNGEAIRARKGGVVDTDPLVNARRRPDGACDRRPNRVMG